MPRKKKDPTQELTETQEQILFVTWLKKMGYRPHHSPNGGRRNLLEALKFKRMGCEPGWPDIIVAIMRGGYGAFFCEMKPKKGGRLSDNQSDWLRHLREEGYYANEAHGFEEAKEQFEHYLSLGKGAKHGI